MDSNKVFGKLVIEKYLVTIFTEFGKDELEFFCGCIQYFDIDKYGNIFLKYNDIYIGEKDLYKYIKMEKDKIRKASNNLLCSGIISFASTGGKNFTIIDIRKLHKITFKDVYKYMDIDENKPITNIKRNSAEYKLFMTYVLERDNSTCQCCDSKQNPEVHHILNYAKYKELRTEVDNGIVLCECCHSPMIKGSFHNTYGTRNNTKEQLQEYVNNKREELGLEPKTI